MFSSCHKLKQHKDLAQHKRSKNLNKVTVNKHEFFQNNETAESPDGEDIEGEPEISEDEDKEDLETSWVECNVCK